MIPSPSLERMFIETFYDRHLWENIPFPARHGSCWMFFCSLAEWALNCFQKLDCEHTYNDLRVARHNERVPGPSLHMVFLSNFVVDISHNTCMFLSRWCVIQHIWAPLVRSSDYPSFHLTSNNPSLLWARHRDGTYNSHSNAQAKQPHHIVRALVE